jgi:hypothetical protein
LNTAATLDEIDTTPLAELAEAVQDVATKIGQLQQHLAEPFADDDREALADAVGSLQALGEDVDEATSALNAQGERAQELIAALQADVDGEAANVLEACGSVRGCIDAQHAELTAALAQARAGFDDVTNGIVADMKRHQQETLDRLRSTLLDSVQKTFVAQIAGADAAQREQVRALNGEIERTLELLMELIESALKSVSDSLNAALDSAAGERRATQPALDAVSAVLDPLLEQVERVKGLASSVGIDI